MILRVVCLQPDTTRESSMPYDPSRLGSDEPATDPQSIPPSDRPNPFLQFVDPPVYRRLVERALGRTEAGRLVTPLSRVQQRKGGASVLGCAWDEELADDAV
jgi:hypothetical protein